MADPVVADAMDLAERVFKALGVSTSGSLGLRDVEDAVRRGFISLGEAPLPRAPSEAPLQAQERSDASLQPQELSGALLQAREPSEALPQPRESSDSLLQRDASDAPSQLRARSDAPLHPRESSGECRQGRSGGEGIVVIAPQWLASGAPLQEVSISNTCSVQELLDAIATAGDLGDSGSINVMLEGQLLDARDTLAGHELGERAVVHVVRHTPDEWLPELYCHLPGPDADELSRDAKAVPLMVPFSIRTFRYAARGLVVDEAGMRPEFAPAAGMREQCSERVDPSMSYQRRRRTVEFAEGAARRRELPDFSYERLLRYREDMDFYASRWRANRALQPHMWEEITDTLPRVTVESALESARAREAAFPAELSFACYLNYREDASFFARRVTGQSALEAHRWSDLSDSLPRRTMEFAAEAARAREDRLQALVSGRKELCTGSRRRREGETPDAAYLVRSADQHYFHNGRKV